MGTTTRAALRLDVGRRCGMVVETVTTSAGAAGATTAVASTLSQYSDDYFNGWFAVLPTGPTDGTGTYEAKYVSDFASSTGTLTTLAFSAQVASGQTLHLYSVNPEYLHDALNRAGQTLYRDDRGPLLYLPVVDESLIVGNLLSSPAVGHPQPEEPAPRPVIAPPLKATLSAAFSPSLAACAVRTLARTDTFMPI